MFHADIDSFSTSWDDHDGLLPLGFVHERRARHLEASLAKRRERLAGAEEEESSLFLCIQDAESMGRHVPAFLERKLARVRERLVLLRGQVLSLEAQLDGDS